MSVVCCHVCVTGCVGRIANCAFSFKHADPFGSQCVGAMTSVCREGNPSHTHSAWTIGFSKLAFPTRRPCPPSLVQRLSRGEEIRSLIQDERLPASQYGLQQLNGVVCLLGKLQVAISICTTTKHRGRSRKQQRTSYSQWCLCHSNMQSHVRGGACRTCTWAEAMS